MKNSSESKHFSPSDAPQASKKLFDIAWCSRGLPGARATRSGGNLGAPRSPPRRGRTKTRDVISYAPWGHLTARTDVIMQRQRDVWSQARYGSTTPLPRAAQKQQSSFARSICLFKRTAPCSLSWGEASGWQRQRDLWVMNQVENSLSDQMVHKYQLLGKAAQPERGGMQRCLLATEKNVSSCLSESEKIRLSCKMTMQVFKQNPCHMLLLVGNFTAVSHPSVCMVCTEDGRQELNRALGVCNSLHW